MKQRLNNVNDGETPISVLFVDIGGVFLTDGWGIESRKLAAAEFSLDFDEMEARHQIMFETYELGKIELDEYLDRMVFFEKRPFTPRQFREFMFAQSQPYPGMIALISSIKKKYGLRIFVVSNEARVLNDFRIDKFQLDSFVDVFISSCFVHMRKPDADIYRLAIDLAHIRPENALYIDNTQMFVQIAELMGIKSILHTDLISTREKLSVSGFNAQ